MDELELLRHKRHNDNGREDFYMDKHERFVEQIIWFGLENGMVLLEPVGFEYDGDGFR